MLATLMAVALLATPAHSGALLKLPKPKPAATSHKAKSKSKSKPKAKVAVAPKTTTVPSNDPVADPLAAANDGRMQCYNPDTVNRTCASLAEYSSNGDGTWANISSVLINPAPPVVMKTITPVSVKDSAICGEIKPEDVSAATLTVSGNVLAADAAAPILIKIGDAMSKLYGHQICTRFYPNGIDYTAKVTIDGEAGSMPDNEVLWVGPKDGYVVAPKG